MKCKVDGCETEARYRACVCAPSTTSGNGGMGQLTPRATSSIRCGRTRGSHCALTESWINVSLLPCVLLAVRCEGEGYEHPNH